MPLGFERRKSEGCQVGKKSIEKCSKAYDLKGHQKGGVMIKLEAVLNQMWEDYLQLNPQAQQIYAALLAEGETVLNDHIALRTFEGGPLGIDNLAQPFLELGYQYRGDYHFESKHLYAKHYEHPQPQNPKIFISELQVHKLSPQAQGLIAKLIQGFDSALTRRFDFSWSGRPWSVSYQDYQMLAQESEYAAWLAAHGFRPNHFTVNVNVLKKWPELSQLNAFLQSKGFVLNASGGLIKGTPAELLEQSSTMAGQIEVAFSDGRYLIPGCYYEFAKRYPMKDGRLYQGFIAKSADKIFESTNRQN